MSTVVAHYKILLKRCYKYGISNQDAEDIVQELALEEVVKGSKGIGYFMNAARNMSLEYKISKYKKYAYIDDVDDSDEESTDITKQKVISFTTNDSIDKARQLKRLDIALATLKPAQKAAALAENHRTNESIKNHYKRALIHLREQKDFI